MLRVFQLNVPTYFDPQEEDELLEYLNRYGSSYFIIEIEDQIVGCGGYHLTTDNKGRLSWDLMDPRHQGQGLGRLLIEHCLAQIRKQNVAEFEVWTSQKAYKFFERFGFAVKEIKQNHWGAGLHLYRMEM